MKNDLRSIIAGAVCGTILGAVLVFVSFDKFTSLGQSIGVEIAKTLASPVKKIVEEKPKPKYPIGTFEYEVKRTE